MAIEEFDLIQRFFNRDRRKRKDVILGIGDDAALLKVPPRSQLAVSTDTLCAGVHFLQNTSPADIAYKALAVNLSDLAAMGAEPAWILLALTLPTSDEIWLNEFMRGFRPLMRQFRLQLVGGDVSAGPLAITIQALGFVPIGKALCRMGAKPGDRIYVSGTLGDAGLALSYVQKKRTSPLARSHAKTIMRRLNRPQPRIKLALALRTIASSAIDISDGLAADLGHVLLANKVGATIQLTNIPLSNSVKALLPNEQAWRLALSAGDDYELCFTVPQIRVKRLRTSLLKTNTSYTCIGFIQKRPGLLLLREDGSLMTVQKMGYQHFT